MPAWPQGPRDPLKAKQNIIVLCPLKTGPLSAYQPHIRSGSPGEDGEGEREGKEKGGGRQGRKVKRMWKEEEEIKGSKV